MSLATAEGELPLPTSPDTSFTATETTTAMTSPAASAPSSPGKDAALDEDKNVIVVKHGTPEPDASPPASPTSPSKAPDTASSSPPDMADISTLRAELEAAISARAAIATRAEVLEAELYRFKDQHAFVSAAKEALETQLREEKTKREAAEEQVEILRGQVEAARRGVMQLQKQEQDRAAHRTSRQMDGVDEEAAVDARKAKRSSLYGLGLTAKSPRPVSSTSAGEPIEPPIPAKSGLRELRLGSNAAGGNSRGGKSAALKLSPPSPGGPPSPRTPRAIIPLLSSPSLSMSPPRATPTVDEAQESESSALEEVLAPKPPSRRGSAVSASATSAISAVSAVSGEQSEHIERLKAARIETEALKTQVEALEVKLMEADEARQASEDCLRALREFIAADPNAGNDGGDASSLRGISLPPLPTDKDHDELDHEPAPALSSPPPPEQSPAEQKAGWGFNMWRRESMSQPAGATSPPSQSTAALPSPPVSPQPASPSIAVSPPATISEVLMQSPEIANKDEKAGVTSFFSGWTKPAAPPPPPPEPEAEAEPATGANLGRKMTSFFGRRARMGSRAAAREAEEKAEREEAQAQLEEEEDAPHAAAVAAAMGEVTFPSIAEAKPKRKGRARGVPGVVKTRAAEEDINNDDDIADLAAVAAVAAAAAAPADKSATESSLAEATSPHPKIQLDDAALSPETGLAYLDDEDAPPSPQPSLTAPLKPARSPSRTSPGPTAALRLKSTSPSPLEPRTSLDAPSPTIDRPRSAFRKPRASASSDSGEPRISLDSPNGSRASFDRLDSPGLGLGLERPRASFDSTPASPSTLTAEPQALAITPVRKGSLPLASSPISRSPLSTSPSPSLAAAPARGSSLGGTSPVRVESPYAGEEIEEVQSENEGEAEAEVGDGGEGKPVRPQRRNASRRGRGGASAKVTRKPAPKERGGFV